MSVRDAASTGVGRLEYRASDDCLEDLVVLDAEPDLCARPTVVDLYAGAGGLSLGLEQAGFDVVAAAEFDPIHALVHRFNFPETPVLCRDLGGTDVQDVASELRAVIGSSLPTGPAARGGIDALVGGPPCQGFSVGGVRDELDARNNQLLRYVDLVVELQPKVFLFENVAGLLEPRFEPLRKEVARRLTVDGGYEISGFDRAYSATDFGVPQRRRRVIVMGSRVGSAPSLANFLEPSAVTVGDALEGLPNPARYHRLLRHDDVTLRDDDVSAVLASHSSYARKAAGLEEAQEDFSWPRSEAGAVHTLTSSLRTVHTARTVARFSRTPQGAVEQTSRLFRLDPASQARTLRAGTGSDRGSHTSPRPIHPHFNRVITVREAARLHGYPDWFRFHATNWHGHRQVGNSVPPPLAFAAGRALMQALGWPPIAKPTRRVGSGNVDWLRLGGKDAASEAAALGREG